ARVVEPEDRAERLDQPRLGEAGHADQQGVSARQQRDQGLLDDLALAENDLADPVADKTQPLAESLDLGDEIRGTGAALGGVEGCGGYQSVNPFSCDCISETDGKPSLWQFFRHAAGHTP